MSGRIPRPRQAVRWIVAASTEERVLVSVASLLISLVFLGVLILVSGAFASCREPFLVTGIGAFCYDPIEVYVTILNGAFGSVFNLSVTLQTTTLLIVAGVAVAITFRGGMFNIGTQGQFVLGGLSTGVVAPLVLSFVPNSFVGGLVALLVGLAAGVIVGGFYGALPGALRAYYDANIVVTTIMLNIIASGVAFALVRLYFRKNEAIKTPTIPNSASIEPILFPKTTGFSLLALALALLLAIGAYYVMYNSPFGYNVRIAGIQGSASDFAGFHSARVIVGTMTISGCLGGLAGALFVLMIQQYWQPGLPPIGFDGIAVSVLAANNPLGAIPAAFLFGVLKSGSLAVDMSLGVPRQLTDVIRGVIILFVAMPQLIKMYGVRFGGNDERS
jgi:simple sugar transport system permease protein